MTSAADRWTDPRPDPPLRSVSLAALRAAAEGLHGIVMETPLLRIPGLDAQCGVPIFLKGEHLQPIGAFKVRGAYTAASRIPAELRARGLITYSSGNHGQAVAWAARRLDTRAVVVMPERAPAVKVEGVRRLGGDVIIAGNSSAERYTKAQQMVEEQGFIMVPPFESLDVIAGQGTCGLEIIEQCPEVQNILVPVGGGGLIAGIAAAAAALKPEVQVIGVEPAGAPKLARALEAGRPVKLDHTESLADGLLPLSIGTIPFGILSGIVRQSVLVDEAEIVEALRFLYHQGGLSVEPSGAVTTAALLAGRVRVSGPTVAVVSGGNVEPAVFQRLVQP
ncbi:MAG TPA: threonine/serine dehydratase [Gemmatimonadales bacterium]|nr:threonine/serine dehydratase [Gemmatimonadales bacterium]